MQKFKICTKKYQHTKFSNELVGLEKHKLENMFTNGWIQGNIDGFIIKGFEKILNACDPSIFLR